MDGGYSATAVAVALHRGHTRRRKRLRRGRIAALLVACLASQTAPEEGLGPLRPNTGAPCAASQMTPVALMC